MDPRDAYQESGEGGEQEAHDDAADEWDEEDSAAWLENLCCE